MWDFNKIGGTTDDSAGEAFDKVAKMMWLGYPGGPIISQLAEKYTLEVVRDKPLFPRVWLTKDKFDFSFSGLKSAVKREVDKRWDLSEVDQIELSYEFQNAVTEVLAYKLVNAARKFWVKTVLLAWWVSANNHLGSLITDMAKREGLEFIYPTKKVFCMDNAGMVGITAYYKILERKVK